jgi:hypothetical protein
LLLFVTRIPLLAAQFSALTVQLVCPLHDPLQGVLAIPTFAETTVQPGAIPTVPDELFIRADTHPATAVP